MEIGVHRRPAVHSVVPRFRWTRTSAGGTLTSVRETAGLRVWLEHGGPLGVVLAPSPEADARDRPLRDLLTRCGTGVLTEAHFPNRASSALVDLVDPAAVGEEPVLVVGHEVRVDEGLGLWYADVDLDVPETSVRLALVRGRVSPVAVADCVPLPPRRELVARPDGRVTVRGPAQPHSRFALRNAEGARTEPTGPSVLAEFVLPQPRAGRAVVEELQPGWALLGPDAGERVTYSESF